MTPRLPRTRLSDSPDGWTGWAAGQLHEHRSCRPNWNLRRRVSDRFLQKYGVLTGARPPAAPCCGISSEILSGDYPACPVCCGASQGPRRRPPGSPQARRNPTRSCARPIREAPDSRSANGVLLLPSIGTSFSAINCRCHSLGSMNALAPRERTHASHSCSSVSRPIPSASANVRSRRPLRMSPAM